MLRPVYAHTFVSSRSGWSPPLFLRQQSHGYRRSGAPPLPTDIDLDTLRNYFTLTESNLAQAHQCRGILHKLGLAVLLCTLLWRGSFLRSMQNFPSRTRNGGDPAERAADPVGRVPTNILPCCWSGLRFSSLSSHHSVERSLCQHAQSSPCAKTGRRCAHRVPAASGSIPIPSTGSVRSGAVKAIDFRWTRMMFIMPKSS